MLIDSKGYEFSWCVLYFLLQYGKLWVITTYILSKWLYGPKGRLFTIWLIRFLVKALYDFFLAWTHFISNERIYIYWSSFGKLGYKLVVLGKTGLQIAHSNKVRGQRFWYLKHCWFQLETYSKSQMSYWTLSYFGAVAIFKTKENWQVSSNKYCMLIL